MPPLSQASCSERRGTASGPWCPPRCRPQGVSGEASASPCAFQSQARPAPGGAGCRARPGHFPPGRGPSPPHTAPLLKIQAWRRAGRGRHLRTHPQASARPLARCQVRTAAPAPCVHVGSRHECLTRVEAHAEWSQGPPAGTRERSPPTRIPFTSLWPPASLSEPPALQPVSGLPPSVQSVAVVLWAPRPSLGRTEAVEGGVARLSGFCCRGSRTGARAGDLSRCPRAPPHVWGEETGGGDGWGFTHAAVLLTPGLVPSGAPVHSSLVLPEPGCCCPESSVWHLSPEPGPPFAKSHGSNCRAWEAP